MPDDYRYKVQLTKVTEESNEEDEREETNTQKKTRLDQNNNVLQLKKKKLEYWKGTKVQERIMKKWHFYSHLGEIFGSKIKFKNATNTRKKLK